MVDLGDREVLAGPSHPRFDSRVFGEAELGRLRASQEPELERWVRWAAKEAAFKLALKLDPAVIFSPRRFEVTLLAPGRAEVRHAGQRFEVRILEAGKAVHAVARVPGSPERLVAAVEARRHGADPSRAARSLAARVLADELELPRRALRFGRRGRIPIARAEGLSATLDLSLSHHGRFVAFACDVGSAA